MINPEKVKLWQFGSDLITTWEVGSNIEFITEWEGQIFKQWGKVLAIKLNGFIKQTELNILSSADLPNGSQVSQICADDEMKLARKSARISAISGKLN